MADPCGSTAGVHRPRPRRPSNQSRRTSPGICPGHHRSCLSDSADLAFRDHAGSSDATRERCKAYAEQIIGAGDSADPGRAAEALIEEFGSLVRALHGSPNRQLEVTNDPAAVAELSAFRRAMLYILRTRLKEKPILGNWPALLDYLQFEMPHRSVERVRVLFLNLRNELVRDELMSVGTIDQSSLHVREVISRALELGAAALILVHNHPSGDPAPSQADIALTRAIARAGHALGIVVHDHLIMAPSGHSSMRELKLL